MSTLYYILVIGLPVALIIFIDVVQVKKLKRLNKKIENEPDYLKDNERRKLCKEVLNQMYWKGPVTLMEMKKLYKNIKRYEENIN